MESAHKENKEMTNVATTSSESKCLASVNIARLLAFTPPTKHYTETRNIIQLP